MDSIKDWIGGRDRRTTARLKNGLIHCAVELLKVPTLREVNRSSRDFDSFLQVVH